MYRRKLKWEWSSFTLRPPFLFWAVLLIFLFQWALVDYLWKKCFAYLLGTKLASFQLWKVIGQNKIFKRLGYWQLTVSSIRQEQYKKQFDTLLTLLKKLAHKKFHALLTTNWVVISNLLYTNERGYISFWGCLFDLQKLHLKIQLCSCENRY